MLNTLPAPFRCLLIAASVAALFSVTGCESDPVFGDDFRVIRYSPGYLRAAYVYTGKDAVSEADESFRVGNYQLYGAVGFGTYYPGCRPGVGEKIARQYGTNLLTEPYNRADIDARDYYLHTTLNYAAKYNAEMVNLLGATPGLPRKGASEK